MTKLNWREPTNIPINPQLFEVNETRWIPGITWLQFIITVLIWIGVKLGYRYGPNRTIFILEDLFNIGNMAIFLVPTGFASVPLRHAPRCW